MKKILVVVAMLGFASSAMAAIAGSSHDMRAAPRNGNLPACQYCHAPHLFKVSNLSGAPLWNRNHNGTATVYTSTTLDTGKGPLVVGPNSRTCLSCHDGVTAPSAVNNGSSTAIATLTGNFNVGNDLTNDHPVGVTYLVTANNYIATTLPLYAGRVECASCHDVHGLSGSNFLRDTGDICARCHIK